MSHYSSSKRLAVWSLAAASFCAAQAVTAHTTIRNQGKEGTSTEHAVNISHGCAGAEGETAIPVIAQSAVFPNNVDSTFTRLDTNQPVQLADIVEGDAPVLPIMPNGIQDRSVFRRQKEIADTNVVLGKYETPNVRAFQFWNGKLRTDLAGRLPFDISGVFFKNTSCAKSLQIRVAIANWCTKSQSTDEDNRVDVWMGKLTPLFNDEGVTSVAKNGSSAFWPTLAITRDLTANPLPAACGAGFDVAVEPSAADIDKYLPISGYWPTP